MGWFAVSRSRSTSRLKQAYSAEPLVLFLDTFPRHPTRLGFVISRKQLFVLRLLSLLCREPPRGPRQDYAAANYAAKLACRCLKNAAKRTTTEGRTPDHGQNQTRRDANAKHKDERGVLKLSNNWLFVAAPGPYFWRSRPTQHQHLEHPGHPEHPRRRLVTAWRHHHRRPPSSASS